MTGCLRRPLDARLRDELPCYAIAPPDDMCADYALRASSGEPRIDASGASSRAAFCPAHVAARQWEYVGRLW